MIISPELDPIRGFSVLLRMQTTTRQAYARLNRFTQQFSPSATSAQQVVDLSAPERCAKLESLGFVFSEEVKQALLRGAPVVALESTIISHGMPYPQNFETARSVEKVVRENGAVPATIAVLGGKIHVGLETSQLEKLAKLGRKCRKCSRRDLPFVVAEKADGATTVASTMYIAHLAGISVFVTGGIGGVHRGVEQTWDISADLTELGRCPVAVVCAGVKSILDIPRTLECLETNGVMVVSVGTDKFPAFFTPDSGLNAPFRIDTPQQGANLIHANDKLGLNSGMVFAVPVPKEEAAKARVVQKAINTALKEVKSKNIQGRDVTPYILQRVNELSKGQSLAANIALVLNNAKFGSKLAVELCAVRQGEGSKANTTATSSTQ